MTAATSPAAASAASEATDAAWHAWLPLLVHVQSHLEDDLSLAALARHAGLPPTQLHRRFSADLGETPRRYVARLRLERAAFRLLVQEATITDIALESGFDHHETFTRAFARHFGCPPAVWRRRAGGPVTPARADGPPSGFDLSATRLVRLRAQHLAFVRHVGPYESVPQSLFDELEAWADARRLEGPRIWMGIGHDAPGATAADRLRFDAALVVPGPFEHEGRIAHQVLPAADCAMTTHVGPFATLPAAYARILPQALALPGCRLVGLPAVEIYHAARVQTARRLNQTDIALPVQRLAA